MKKIYSDADKTDMPLDSAEKKTAVSKENATAPKKQKINVISSKKSAKNNSASKDVTSNQDKNKNLRAKLKTDSVDNVELEKLNEENLKARGFRGRRNQVIIIILSILLVIAIAVIAIFANISTLESNCFLYTHGDGSAVYMVNGDQLDKFRAPSAIQGNRVLRFDTDLKIKSEGSYNIEFVVEVYQGSLLLENVPLLGVDAELFILSSDGMYRSRSAIGGDQTIQLFTGVAIDNEYETTLSDKNFKMEVHTYLTKV